MLYCFVVLQSNTIHERRSSLKLNPSITINNEDNVIAAPQTSQTLPANGARTGIISGIIKECTIHCESKVESISKSTIESTHFIYQQKKRIIIYLSRVRSVGRLMCRPRPIKPTEIF